jgi:hypothetical protein
MAIRFLHGGEFRRWHKWVRKKRHQVWKRQYLSETLSLTLAVLVLLREIPELINRWKTLSYSYRQLQWPAGTIQAQEWTREAGQFLQGLSAMILPLLFGLFVLLLVAGTVLAAFWERSPSKLATSPQEIGFVVATRSLLLQLESMTFAGKMSNVEAQARFDKFVDGFLTVTSKTLVGHRKADAGFLMKQQLSRLDPWLERVNSSNPVRLPKGFTLPLPSQTVPEEHCGPGGICFHRGRLVYMPSVKKWKEAWPLRVNEYTYALDGAPLNSWVKAAKPADEDFSSILCVPVGLDKDGKTRYGVLEFTTKAKDEFIDRDFMMAECFASILTQAAAITAAATKP